MPAQKSRLAEAFWVPYTTHLFRRRFAGLHVRGLDAVPRRPAEPILFYGNHSCWWDGLICLLLGRRVLDVENHLMMDERQLARFRFFTRLGAFSVDLTDGRSALRSVEYAADLLRPGDGRALWIYPQGRMLPNDTRPLECASGLARIVEKLDRPTWVVPFAYRYEFLQQERPEAFVSFGPPELLHLTDGNHRQQTARFQEQLTAELDTLRDDVTAGRLGDFRDALPPTRSIHDHWAALRRR